MILFRCDTCYQLMNAIVMKTSLYPEEEADVMLSDHSDFTGVLEPIQKQGIFRNFLTCETREKMYAFHQLPQWKKWYFSLFPERYVGDLLGGEQYDRMYFAVASCIAKMMYYEAVKKGQHPEIGIYEDAVSTYLYDIEEIAARDGFWHARYGSSRFIKNIRGLYLYRPELCCLLEKPYPVLQIPPVPQRGELRDRFEKIFGTFPMPEQKYIFLEEAFPEDRYPANDVELLELLASFVGKEQIIVRPHPRNRMNRFEALGYSIFPKSTVPWEVMLLTNDLSEKVFVTISSNASVTAGLLYGKACTVIRLSRLFVGWSQLLSNKNYRHYQSLLSEHAPEYGMRIFTPASAGALRETIRFLGGEDDGGKAPAFHSCPGL